MSIRNRIRGFRYFFSRSREKEILMLGLPNSGKTVFFCVGMELLQRSFNNLGKDYSVTYKDHDTQTMVSGVMKRLRAQEWPSATDPEFTLDASARITYGGKVREIICRDFSGENFKDTFKGDFLLSGNKTLDEISEYLEKNNAVSTPGIIEKYLKDVKSASSIALIIDSAMLYEDTDDDLYIELFHLMRFIKAGNKLKRLALIFTKNDVAKKTPAQVKTEFESRWPNVYALLKEMKMDHEFFPASAVRCVVNKEAESDAPYIPPKGYSPLGNSQDIEDPLYWLLEMKKPTPS